MKIVETLLVFKSERAERDKQVEHRGLLNNEIILYDNIPYDNTYAIIKYSI